MAPLLVSCEARRKEKKQGEQGGKALRDSMANLDLWNGQDMEWPLFNNTHVKVTLLVSQLLL